MEKPLTERVPRVLHVVRLVDKDVRSLRRRRFGDLHQLSAIA